MSNRCRSSVASIVGVLFAVAWGWVLPATRAEDAPESCRLTEADVDGDGAPEVVLENRYLKVTVKPSSGGRLARVEYKPTGVDLTCFGPYRGEGPGGLFGDRITAQTYPGDYLAASAATKVLDNSSEKVRVRLTSRGVTGPAADLYVDKEFALERDRASLEVLGAITYRTGRLDTGAFKAGLWWQHILRLGQAGSQAGFANTYFVPLSTGILTLPFVPQTRNEFKTDDGFLRNPARGWLGCVATPPGSAAPVGAVFTLDYSQLLHYYICMAPSMLEFPTVEWYYQPGALADGGSFRTAVRLMPFRGLTEITGAGDGLVGSLRFGIAAPKVGDSVPVHVGLASDRTRQVTVEMTDRLLTWTTGEGAPEPVTSRGVSLTVDGPAALDLTLPLQRPGTHVVGVRVLGADRQPLVVFEKPLVVGKPSGNYALTPVVPRVVADPSVKQRANLAGPATPHVPWAKPLRGGPLRVLVVTELATARQVVELGQRLDMDCDDVLNAGAALVEKETSLLWGQRGSATRQHFDVDEHESETERLRRLLTENRYEAMLVNPGALCLRNVPDDVRELVVQRVHEGMGLVCLGPGPQAPGASWLEAVVNVRIGPGPAIPHHSQIVGKEEKFRGDGVLTTVNPGLMHASGFAAWVPLALFPPTALYAQARLAKNEGDALVAYDANPLLILGTSGAGRVATLNAAWHNLELNTYYEDQAPAMRGERYQEFPYFEYSYLLLAKTLLWAARREPDVRLQAVDVRQASASSGIELAVRLADPGKVQTRVSIEANLRDAWSRTVAWREPVPNPPSAATTVPPAGAVFRAPGPLVAGRYTADVIVRDADGRAIDCGSVLVSVPGHTTVLAVTPRHPSVELGEPAAFRVEVASDAAATVQLAWRLVDTFRRCLQAGTVPVQLAPGRRAAEFATAPLQCESAIVDVEVELRAESAPLSRHVSYLFVRRPAQIDDIMFEVYIAGGGPRGDRSFPFLRDLGVDAGGVEFQGYPWNGAFLAVKSNIRPLFGSQFISDFGYYGAPLAVRTGTPATWADVKPDDPANIRVWPGITRPGAGGYPLCAHAPSALEGRRERVRTRAPVALLYSPLDFFIADEALWQHDVYARTAQSQDDQCFCRHCLAAFRDYLKTQYPSLAALNAEWDTAWQSWDEVMPLPGRQARRLDNWSRWLDFRVFTAKSFCRSVVAVQDELRQFDARARTSANVHWESPWTAYMACYLHGPGANATCEFYPRTFEQGRSYSPEPAFRRLHIGYATYTGHPRTMSEHYIWRNLGYGGGRTDFYNGIEGLYGGVLTPAFAVAPMGEWLKELDATMRRSGIGKAILTSQPDPPVVGVLESYPSEFSYYLEPQQFDPDGYYRRDDYALWNEVKRWWGSCGYLAEDLGLSWRLVNEEECAAAVPPGMRVLLLPRATCLAAGTARVLDEFVRAGGVAIADVRLGERDGHGRLLPPGEPAWLSESFGVRRTPTGCAEVPMKFTAGTSGLLERPAALRSTCHEPGLRAAGAEAYGSYDDGAANTLLRQHGKGWFVYLNYELWGYGSDRSPAVRALLGAVLKRAGVQAASALVGADGQPALNALCLRRTRGPVDYYFILRNLYGPALEGAVLALPAPAHLYDVGAHRYLGFAARQPVDPEISRGQLIAALPYRMEGLALAVAGKAVPGQSVQVTATLTTTAGNPGDHVIHLEVTRPDGSPCPWWSGNVLAVGGRYTAAWNLALDEAPGTWQGRALDVLSGKEAHAAFTVAPPAR